MKEPFDNDESIIQPRKRSGDPSVGLDVLLALIPEDLDYLVRLHQDKEQTCHDMGFFKIYQVKDEAMGLRTICGPFIGAPQAVMGTEKLIALGARRLWILGWCGSLQPSLRIGDLVIPMNAISEEGTSQHYPIPSKEPHTDHELNQILQTTLQSKGQSYTMGKVWTTDAPYRETHAKIKAYQGQGVLAVEMEMSALMAVAIFRAVKLAGLLVVSDELFDLTWHAGFKNSVFKAKRQWASEMLLGILASCGQALEKPF